MAGAQTILDGVKVLDLTRFLSGPQATFYLAALGAEVVRIDDPVKGDPAAGAPPFMGPKGISMNRQSADDLGVAYLKRGRGKKSVALDLKSEEDRVRFFRLVEQADVLVENFRVGVTKRLGIDYAALRAVNPKLIYCSITGYGSTGPESSRKAYDLMVQASSGLMSITGESEGQPQKAGSPLSDGIAGTFALSGILGALLHRSKMGEGQFIDVSMCDCLVALLYDEPWDCYDALALPFRQGNRIMRFSPFNMYPARDGMVALGAATQEDWVALLEMIGRTELMQSETHMDPGWRISNNDTIDAIVGAWTEGRTVGEIIAQCEQRALACSPIRHVTELADWEQMRQRTLLKPVRHPHLPDSDGPLGANFPLKFSATPAQQNMRAARAGEHTQDVLEAWLGAAEIHEEELQ